MKKHILLIDDDIDELDLLQDALQEMAIPHKVTWAKSGSQALEQLRYLAPDIIFLDINMPNMNGLECLTFIKQLPDRENIPVILCSTGMNPDISRQGLQAGAAACVKKANTFNELSDVLNKYLKWR